MPPKNLERIWSRGPYCSINNAAIPDEISQAITEIKSISELSAENTASIIDLLGQVKDSIQSGDENAQTEAKFTLKGMLKRLGNAGVKVVSVLSGLANLAKFFGFPAPM